MRNEELRQILQGIEDKHGHLDPVLITKLAQDKRHPLHSEFNWDNDKCGDLWRLQQAAELIRRVKVTFTIEERAITVPGYVHNPAADSNQRQYINVKALRQDNDNAHAALVAEFSAAGAHLRRARDLAQVLGRAGQLTELLNVFDKTAATISSGGDEASA